MICDLENCHVLEDGYCAVHKQPGMDCRKQAITEFDRLRLDLENAKLQVSALNEELNEKAQERLRWVKEIETLKLQVNEKEAEIKRLTDGLTQISHTGASSRTKDYHALPDLARKILGGYATPHVADLIEAHCDVKDKLRKDLDCALLQVSETRAAVLDELWKFATSQAASHHDIAVERRDDDEMLTIHNAMSSAYVAMVQEIEKRKFAVNPVDQNP
jgi:hypothetical protein